MNTHTTREGRMLERIARAVFAAMEQQAFLHPLTDFDSEWANRRGDYLGVPVPSRVDRAMEVARAAVEAMRYEDGWDEDIAIAAGRRIQCAPVMAIECLDEWIDVILQYPNITKETA